MTAFSEDSEVTPLPCDIRHYFHTNCIEDWFKVNNVCPLCKKVITKEDLDKFEHDFEKICKDHEKDTEVIEDFKDE